MQGSGLPRDKAALVWQGKTLLERATTLLQTVCETHGILCGTEERCLRLRLGGRGIVDRLEGMGPLGGLEASLADARKHNVSWVLIVPVDLPQLTSDLLRRFVALALVSQAGASCLRDEGLTHPLPALVRVDALPLVQEFLTSGGRRVLTALNSVAQQLTPKRGLAVIDRTDLQSPGDSSRCFWNVNTPEEYQLLLQHETSEVGLHQSTNGK